MASSGSYSIGGKQYYYHANPRSGAPYWSLGGKRVKTPAGAAGALAAGNQSASPVVATPGATGAPASMTGQTAADTSNIAAQAAAAPSDASYYSTGSGPAVQYQPQATYPYYLAGTVTPSTTAAGSSAPGGLSG